MRWYASQTLASKSLCSAWFGYPIALEEKVGNAAPFRRRIRKQKDRVLADIYVQLGETVGQDLIETVMADDAPGAGDLRVKIDLQHYLIFLVIEPTVLDSSEPFRVDGGAFHP